MLTEYWLDAHAQIESTSGLALDLIEENKLLCALSYQIVECNNTYMVEEAGEREGVAPHIAFFNQQKAVNKLLAF